MGNVILFEIKYNLKSLIVWLIVASIFSLMFISMFDIFVNGMVELQSILESYPQGLLKTIGLDFDIIGRVEGFYSFILSYLSLISFAFASVMTLNIFGKEFKSGSSEFLFSKPRTRTKIFFAKYLSILLFVTLFYLATLIINYIFIIIQGDFDFTIYLKTHTTLFYIMLLAVSITTLISVVWRKIRSFGGVGLSIAFLFYFIFILSGILDETKVLYVSVYGLFSAATIYMVGYETTNIVIALLMFILFTVLSVVIFNKKDVL